MTLEGVDKEGMEEGLVAMVAFNFPPAFTSS
jgi:hypothetical protein